MSTGMSRQEQVPTWGDGVPKGGKEQASEARWDGVGDALTQSLLLLRSPRTLTCVTSPFWQSGPAMPRSLQHLQAPRAGSCPICLSAICPLCLF